ncbi:MAG: hypothetical protein PHT57_09625 [Rhodoferax sp.]|nr:hypothetical protein [Rhodoferax sp.]
MSHLRQTALALVLATTAIGAWALTDAQQQHQAHVLATEQAAVAPAEPAAAANAPLAMDSKMKAMDDMHQKMMNAKSPEEKQVLMAEHMKSMQQGMQMKQDMKMMGKMGSHHQMMEKRMAMMETMMQLMMERMPAAATK